MMRNAVKKLTSLVSIFVCLILFAGLFSACSLKKEEDNSYAITGYVFDESGNPVEGVLISSDVASSTTDKDGKYIISGIESAVILSPSKKGYKFKEISKSISSKNDDANFLAFKEYNLSGVAHNNGVALANANVVVSSLSGTFYTTTDEYGKFEVLGVAGESTVNCEVDSLQFYEVKTTIDNPNVQIITSSSLTINFDFKTEYVDYSKIELYVDGTKMNVSSETKVIEDIDCGTVVEIKSSEYHFGRTTKFIVSKLNQVETFECEKIYSISGNVKSGNIAFADARILVDGKLAAYSGGNGNFVLSGLYGNHKVSAEYLGFVFEDILVDENNIEANFVGTKSVNLKFAPDFDNGFDFEVKDFAVAKVGSFEYKVSGVEIGDRVEVLSSKYHLPVKSFVIDDRFSYELSANAFFSATLADVDLEGYVLLLDGSDAEESDLENLFGTHKISARFDNYIFTEAEVDFNSTEAVISYLVPYSVQIEVYSGSIKLENAKISYADTFVLTDENGLATVEGLVLENTIEISANGYNSRKIVVGEASLQTVELNYNVSGFVLSGDNAVISATVSAGEKQTTTNEYGYFEIADLVGANTIAASKENYSFVSQNVSSEKQITISGSFAITGNISIEGEPVSNYLVHLVDAKTSTEQTTRTDASGNYSFENLNGTFLVYATADNGAVELKPLSHTVVGAGRFNFSSSGYSVSGYIKTGNVAIANVKVVAGSETVYTDADGKYSFELLTQECSIYAEKEGYLFSGAIPVSEDTQNANFTATYSVSGKVIVDGKPIEGVKVTIGGVEVYTDKNGAYTVSGLEGAVEVKFEKAGYQFTSSGTVSGVVDIPVSSKVVATAIVKTGNIQVFNFECYAGGEKQQVENGVASFIFEKGTVVTFEKDGYVISSITPTEPKEYVANATYSISGNVSSGNVSLAGTYVYIKETDESKQTLVATTNTRGNFEVSGIVGEQTLLFVKNGFVIEEKVVSAAGLDIKANATYKIYGTVYVGSKTLAGVKVACGEAEFTTLADGKFEFTSISGNFGLTFEKDGYSFDEIEADKFGEQKFTIDAKYSISGFVKTGGIAIENATITAVLEGGREIETTSAADGSFVIENISGIADIIASKENYIPATIFGFSDLSTNVAANLKYNVTINFDVAGVTVYVNNKKQVVSGKTVTLSGLEGENLVRLELANASFSRNNIKITMPGTLSISHTKSYKISGYVKADTGLPIANIEIVSKANDIAVTDANGFYQFQNVAGEISINDENITKETKNVTADGEYNFIVSNQDFAYMLFAKGYKNLNNAASVQIFGTGVVVGDAGITKTTQYVHSMFKRDNNGNIIKQNLNYGDAVLGIDPKVSLLTYYEKNGINVQYQQLEDGDVKNKTYAEHTVNNNNGVYSLSLSATVSDYKATFGEAPTDYSPYDITKSKITGYSAVTINGSGNYQFTLSLSTTQTGYSKRIVALSGVEFKSFSKIQLTYEVSKSGWIASVDAHDEYKIKQGVEVSITSDVKYVYHTNKANLKIDDITLADLNKSLAKSNQTEITEAPAKLGSDLITNLIYGK